MRRWFLALVVLIACCALANVYGAAASENSSAAGAAFCTSFPNTSATNASFNGVVACWGPGYTEPVGFRGALTQPGTPSSRGGSWQCTEFASRYFATVTGKSAPSDSTGAQWVADTHRRFPQYGLGGGRGTGTFDNSIAPGVIISMRGGAKADPTGHVAVVASVSVTHGTGSITVVGENVAGYSTIQVTRGVMTYGSATDSHYYTRFQWLTGLPGGTGGAPTSNGSLVRTPDDSVYVIAGDAPVRLDTCAYTAHADCSTAIEVSDLSGYMPVPVDGTVLRDAGTGATYVVAGGAPLQLGSCSFTAGGNCATAVTVDGDAISQLDHLQAQPTNGTLLHDANTGAIYVIAGGAPLRLGSCAFTPGGYCSTAVTIDDYAISMLDHLQATPSDYTVLRDGTNGHMYIVAGGAPVRIGSCSFTPGGYCATAVTIDDSVITRDDHLRAVPVDGTVLHDAGTGLLYTIAKGTLRRLASCAGTPGGNCGTAVTIDAVSLAVLARTHASAADEYGPSRTETLVPSLMARLA